MAVEIWDSPKEYRYQSGMLYLGRDQKKQFELGVATERHAITIAGAGAGKGACVIIPNLKRWPHNALVIDPKGEAVAATLQDRINFGQSVRVIDPFRVAAVDEKFRAGFNPLRDIDPKSRTIREEIRVIADGIVKRSDPRHEMWDDAAVSILAGLIAFVKVAEPKESQTLSRMRDILRTEEVHSALEVMANRSECAGLLQTAAGVMQDEQANAFLAGARRHTEWLDTPDIADVMRTSTFSLSDLKHESVSVFLVLPADMIEEHGRFLRLFVRCSIKAMQQQVNGVIRDKQCLFLLDEFFSLGKIDEIEKAAGLMRGYGLQLWTILQDLGQLTKTYGNQGAGTFFSNADLHQFFGNTDQITLEAISHGLGVTTIDEIPDQPIAPGGSVGGALGGSMSQSKDSGTRMLGGMIGVMSAAGSSLSQTIYNSEAAAFQKEMARVNRPRLPADAVAGLVQSRNDTVADNMICFTHGGSRLLVKPAPYFREIWQELAPTNKIEALKAYRTLHGVGLKEAQIAVEEYLGVDRGNSPKDIVAKAENALDVWKEKTRPYIWWVFGAIIIFWVLIGAPG